MYGPLGRYVKLTPEAHAQHYGTAVESILSGILRNFLVTNRDDEILLNNLINNTPGGRAENITIITYTNTKRISDDRLAQIQGVRTVLQCVSIAEDAVYNYILDNTRIDGVVVCEEGISDERYVSSVNEYRKFRGDIYYSVDINGTTLKCVGGVSNCGTE